MRFDGDTKNSGCLWGNEEYSASQTLEKYGKMLKVYAKNMFRSIQSFRTFGEVFSEMCH
jgi:hypothetical protein